MDWFNYYGLIFVAVLLIPNIIYMVKVKDGEPCAYKNKAAEILEQISRYACMVLMVFNIPYTWIGFYTPFSDVLYIVINSVLALAYCIMWAIFWKKSGIVKSLLLSVIPSIIFVFSGILLGNIPLAVFAIIFAVTHVMISIKSALLTETIAKPKKKAAITIMSLILSVILIVISSVGIVSIQSQNNYAKLDKMSALDTIKSCATNDTKISVAIIDNGNITYKIYGSKGEEDTLYDYEIGSVSKTFVGLLCTKAITEGKLNLTDSISKYLALDSTKYYPTLERLLTHTSGYQAYYFESNMISNKFARITNDFYGISRSQILNRVKSVTLEDKDYPFVYSNFGIAVVGLVLEKIYNADFTTLMNNYIETDLSLSNTEVAKQSGNLKKYWKWKPNDGYLPVGAIISNIEDMAAYLNVYLTDSVDYAQTAYTKIKNLNVRDESYEKYNVRFDAIATTWILDEQNGIVWHNGSTTDFNSYAGFTKDKKKGVVILSNLNIDDQISMTILGAKLLTEII